MVLCAFFAGGLTAIFPVDNTFSFGPSPSGLSPVSASFTIRLLPIGQGGCLHFRKTNQTSWQLPYPGSGPFPFSGTMAFIVPLDPVFFEPDASARTSHTSIGLLSELERHAGSTSFCGQSWLTGCWSGQPVHWTWLDLPGFCLPDLQGGPSRLCSPGRSALIQKTKALMQAGSSPAFQARKPLDF